MSESRYKEAESVLRRFLEGQRHNVGSEHLNAARALDDLGLVLKSQGKYAEAVYTFNGSLLILEKLLGNENIEYATVLGHLASVRDDQALYDDAESLYRKALEITVSVFGGWI